MESIIEELLAKDETEVNLSSPLVWAYIGDAVYEVYIRTYLVEKTKLNVHNLHISSIKYVKAKAQADILERLMPELTEEEQNIVRRTRNTQNHHLPKNANIADYTHATAFEGLIGYLFLNKRTDRLKELLKKCVGE